MAFLCRNLYRLIFYKLFRTTIPKTHSDYKTKTKQRGKGFTHLHLVVQYEQVMLLVAKNTVGKERKGFRSSLLPLSF